MRLDQEILAQAKAAPVIKPCPCPEFPSLDGKVFAKRVSATTWVAFVRDIPTPGVDPYAMTRFLLFALCDADGKPIFERDAMAMAALAELPAVVIRRWKEIAEALNPFGGDDDEAKKSEPAASTT